MFSKLSTVTPREMRAARRHIRACEQEIASMSAAMAPPPPSPVEFKFSPPPSPVPLLSVKRARLSFIEVPPAQPTPLPPTPSIPADEPPLSPNPPSPPVDRSPSPSDSELQGVFRSMFRPIAPDSSVRPALMPARRRPRPLVIPPTPPPAVPVVGRGPVIVPSRDGLLSHEEALEEIRRRSPFDPLKESVRFITVCRQGDDEYNLLQYNTLWGDDKCYLWESSDTVVIDYVDLTL